MLLSEFKRTMEFPQEFPKDAKHHEEMKPFFLDNGWIKAGSGYMSEVYKNVNDSVNYVIKVNVREDRAFARFALLTHQHPNRHFPVIGNAKVIKAPSGEKFHVYLIEKMKPLQFNDYVYKNYNVIGYFIKAYGSSDGNLENTMHYVSQVISYRGIVDAKKKMEQFEEFMDENPSFVEAIKILGLNGKGKTLDLHSGNFMKRNDGTVVISDPWV